MDHSLYRDPDVVDMYDRLAVPLQFAAPARDLVAAVGIGAGDRVLDVGTGTGVAAIAAAVPAGSEGTVIGIDPSLPMLRRLRSRGTVRAAAARTPDLPFRDRAFDAVTANFVLAHLDDAALGLRHMVRVLRPGGRLGVTSWSGGDTAVARVWAAHVARFTHTGELNLALRTAIPWEEWFADAGHLRTALQEAGLERIDVFHREYPVTLSVTDYLAMKLAGVEGGLLRRRLSDAEWTLFADTLPERFRERFGDSVRYVRRAHVAVGTKRVD